jgi:hypothetical protein
VANDDTAVTDEDAAVLVAVLANDTDPDGDTLSVESVADPPNGAAVVEGDAVRYTPDPGFTGTDAFTYVAADGEGGTDGATVTVNVNAPGNQSPVASDDAAQTDMGVPVLVSVLANDTDPDDDPLFIAAVGSPLNGTAVVEGDAIRYTPAAGFTGNDAFTYTAADGRGGTDAAEVTVTVHTAATVTATVEGEPRSGSAATVRVTVTGFEPTTAELRYRPGGAAAYTTAPLVASGGAYEGAVPAAAVTLRGFDYYVFLSDGQRTLTFPAEDPAQNPVHVRVTVEQAVTALPPPPDAGYRMVSVPLALADAAPEAVFADDYGTYDPTVWRLLRWLPGSERYAEHPDLGAALTPGVAVWLAARAENAFDVEDGASVDAAAPFAVTVAPGWNQIGSPFAFPVAWASVGGSATAGVSTPYAWDPAGGEYVFDQPVLEPWAGYFVENTTGAPVVLTVFPVSAGGERVAAGGAEGYRLRLRAEAVGAAAPGYRDTQNVLGFAEEAAAGRDRFDRAEPPPPGEHVRLSFLDGGGVTAPARLGHSFQPDAGEGAAWEAEVAATAALLRGGALTVRVGLEDEGAARPDGYGLYVLDLERTAALPLEGSEDGSTAAFEVTLSAAEPARRLRVVVGTEAFAAQAAGGIPLVPLDYALLRAYPNPSRGAVVIPYQLAERGPVTLEVYDLLGRRVAVLVDREQDGGRYDVAWTAPEAASGVYVYRLRAGDFTASGKLLVVR